MDTRTSGVAESALALPKGGAALSPLGHNFKVDLHSGGGSYAVPLDLPEGRGGLNAELALQYSTGHGNGPFGLGWRIGLGDVSRKTSDGVPTYDDDRDTFVFSGGEDLVPMGDGRYRPRVESLFARIQRLPAPDGHDCFVVTSRDGVRHVFGGDAQSRLGHPDRPRAIFRWLPSESIEPNGSRMVYRYRHEDGARTAALLVEASRRYHQIYLSRVDYVDYDPGDGSAAFLFRVRFDYGDLDDEGEPAGDWAIRPDPFSTYRAGFEIRTLRRCHRVLLQVRPPGSATYRLIRTWRLGYDEGEPDGVSLLSSVTLVGRRTESAGDAQDVEEQAYPPLRFGYTRTAFDRPRLIPLRCEPGHFLTDTLGNPRIDLVDLNGNGLPDLIDITGDAAFYWENRGEGRFVGPRRLRSLPLEARRMTNEVLVADVDGNASADLYIQDGPRATYYRNRFRAGFEDPVHLTRAPNLRVPGRQYLPMELNGDGAVDLLVLAPDRRLYYHASETARGGVPRRNFSPAAAIRFEPEGGSRLPATAPVRFRLADMTGDGNVALVFLSSGRVSYRPYLGNGRWGAEVLMQNAPVWPHALDPRNLFLVDLTGSGCADLVIVEGHRIRLAVNQSGNRFGPARTIVHTPRLDGDSVRAADLLGRGTSGLVFSLIGSQAGVNRHRFLDLTGGGPPRLLDRIDNGFGGLVDIAYRSAVDDWLRDEARGERLPLPLPIPVPVVASVQTRDVLTGAQSLVEYRYHGGFYDGATREFRGFSLTEEREEGDADADGVLRRTWFHPGTDTNLAGEPVDLSQGYGAPSALTRQPIALPPQLTRDATARAEALRAARGVHLRTEVYALDRGDPVSHPLVVSESAYEIAEVVPRAAERPGVYAPRLVEAVTARDENDGDARKLKRTEVAYDGYGNPVWRRTSGGPETPDPTLPAVQTVEETRRAHLRDDPDPAPDLTAPYRVTYQVDRTFEVIQEEVTDQGRRLIAHRRRHYDGPDFQGQPLTTRPTRGNPVREEALVLTDELIAEAYGDAVPEAAILASGLVPEGVPGARRWWRQEQRRALNGGGLMTALRDPLGAHIALGHDAAGWRIVATTTPAGHTQRITVDYQALQVAEHSDANLQETSYRYTPLGRLRSIIRCGRPGPQGHYPGDTAEAPTVAFVDHLDPVDPAAPLPISTLIINRVITGRDEVERTVEYADGFGDILQKRFEQRPGDLEGSEGMAEAWIASGLKQYAARGLLSRLHGPVLDDTPAWRVTPAMRDAPAGQIRHDALGRLVSSVAPDGTLRSVTHGTWRTRFHDENDHAAATLDPTDPTQAALLNRLGPQLDTPQVQVFDAYDRLTDVIEDLGGGRAQRTQYAYDALDRPVEVRDALSRVALRATYDHTGQVIALTQLDAGTHRFVLNAARSLILRVDARGIRLRTTHDAAGRIHELFALPADVAIAEAWDSPARRLIARYRYGADADPAALATNARGRLMQVLDPVGEAQFAYDRRGDKASITRRFFVSDPGLEIAPGWVAPSVDTRALEDAVYRIDYEHDAAGWLRRVVYPSVDGGARRAVSLERTRLGLLTQATYHADESGPGRTVVAHTLYNVRNARVATWFGNGQATAYQYSSDHPRLTAIVTGPAAPGTLPAVDPLFSLSYHYDLVGNPLAVRRINGSGLRALAGDGRPSLEASSYAYDALHRLTEVNAFDSFAGARQQRLRAYRYDPAGNLIEYGDRAGPPPHLVPGTNRLLGFAQPGDPVPVPVTYDAGGSMTTAPHLPTLVWDERGHLGYVAHASGPEGRYHYDYGGERRRKLVREGGRIRDVRTVDGIFELETVTAGPALIGRQVRAHVLGPLERLAIVVGDVPAGTERLLYPHGDHVTSVLCVTDEAGAPVQLRDYLPYGVPAASAGSGLDRAYAGMTLDNESGLIYMSRRYYDPALGRFLSPDPMMVKYLDGRNAHGIYRPSNLNPYAYAAANPLVYYDPTGGFILGALLVAGSGLLLAGLGQVIQQSGDRRVSGFGKAIEIIGLVGAGAALATIGAALVPIGLLFAAPVIAIPVVGPLLYTGLTVVAGLTIVAAPVIGAVHGAITGSFGTYDLGSPTGYLAFIADTTWGLSQTTLGVGGIAIAGIGGGSVNQGLSDRTNVLATENAFFGGGGVSLGPYIFAGGAFNHPVSELFRHESFHTLQNRIFGPIFTFTVIPLTIISNIMTAIGAPPTNPAFVDAGEAPNWDNWINPWEAWAEAEVP